MTYNYNDIPDNIKYAVLLKGLDENVIKKISFENKEPYWMLEHRLQSFKVLQSKKMPDWALDLSDINFDEIVFFAKPELEKDYFQDREKVPNDIKERFEKLGIPEAEKKYLAGAGGQLDSQVFYHKMLKKRQDLGIVFEDMSCALQKHEQLVKQYFMQLVKCEDHFFSALHGAVWSGGTFVYIPNGIELDQPLQSYFRMNVIGGGQFEHTLIIVGDGAQGEYIEGCSAPKYNKRAIHAGCVEIFVGEGSKFRYSSVENWSLDTYNLNTKRALVQKDGYMEWVSGNFGSGKTMLYPMSVLKGDNSKTEMYGVAVAGKGQMQDIGAKVLHIGKNTSSNIISKSICKDGGINTYRGLVKILENTEDAVNQTRCDALILDEKSVSNTIPYIDTKNTEALIVHEATAGKIDENNLFYLMSKGISQNIANSMIISGFVSGIIKKLPLEYAGELNRMIEVEIANT